MNQDIINSESVKALECIDPIFTMIREKYGLPPSWSRDPGFETLAMIILEQQVSLQSAKACYEKILLAVDSFSPEHIRALSPEELRTLSVSRQKARYMHILADAIMDGSLNLSYLHEMDKDSVMVELTKLTGIGKWTAEVYLMFCLQSPDIFPAGDVAIINTMKELKAATTKDHAVEIAENWAPYRSAATFFLWHYYLKKRNRVAVF